MDIVRQSSVRIGGSPTVVVTFTDSKTLAFAENWAFHLQRARVPGVVIGLVGVNSGATGGAALARARQRFKALGAAVYRVTSPTHARAPQGGRWFSVVPLLETGCRVLLSDSDVVWLRNPLPYLLRLEKEHPRLDLAVSTDAQGASDSRRLDGAELDVEAYRLCRESMNIGIIAFPPGPRPGAKRAIAEAVAHMSLPNALRSVDQGQINHRWKRGAGSWHWPRQMHPITDESGARLCGLVNGSSVAGVLPIAQFGNTLTHGLLKLSSRVQVAGRGGGGGATVAPFAVHATFMRTQKAEYKIARLREMGLWKMDPPSYFGIDGGGGGGARLPQGFISYTPQIPTELLRAKASLPRTPDGGTTLPAKHLTLMWAQLQQLRNALFVARLLRRVLILPEVLCSCELGFHPRHVAKGCRAHAAVELPHACPFDHFLDPTALQTSPYQIRDRTFLADERTPKSVVRSSVLTVQVCATNASAGASCDGDEWGAASVEGVGDENGRRRQPRVVKLVREPLSDTIVNTLGSLGRVRRLHFDDMRAAFGGFTAASDGTPGRAWGGQWYREAQALLSSWCCTSDERFKSTGGLVPYLIPPPKHVRWRPELAAAVKATREFMLDAQ